MSDNIENRIRKIEDSQLLIHSDLKVMGESVAEMAKGLKQLTEIAMQQKVIEERCESRHNQLKAADKVLHERIDRIKSNINKGVWIVLTFVIVGTLKMLTE